MSSRQQSLDAVIELLEIAALTTDDVSFNTTASCFAIKNHHP